METIINQSIYLPSDSTHFSSEHFGECCDRITAVFYLPKSLGTIHYIILLHFYCTTELVWIFNTLNSSSTRINYRVDIKSHYFAFLSMANGVNLMTFHSFHQNKNCLLNKRKSEHAQVIQCLMFPEV